eukprot:snap_masked-scaffold_11-processed-gene-0.13-mRNA-1 protein AED:1.00 eAED:1.00 QI:0/0/0/0/1/1/2/0/73
MLFCSRSNCEVGILGAVRIPSQLGGFSFLNLLFRVILRGLKVLAVSAKRAVGWLSRSPGGSSAGDSSLWPNPA